MALNDNRITVETSSASTPYQVGNTQSTIVFNFGSDFAGPYEVILPQSPVNGHIIKLISRYLISSVTITPGSGHTLGFSSIDTLKSGGHYVFMFHSDTSSWTLAENASHTHSSYQPVDSTLTAISGTAFSTGIMTKTSSGPYATLSAGVDGQVIVSDSGSLTGYSNSSSLADHLADSTIHFTQASISITEAQISDLGAYLLSLNDDSTPQLGGNLDVNGLKIVSTSNGNIDIEPDGTGNVLLGNFTFDADQTVGAGQDNYVMTYDNATGLISLEASSGGGGGTVGFEQNFLLMGA